MTPSTRRKAVAVLDRITDIIEKCGGPGGTMGPCPGGSAGDGVKFPPINQTYGTRTPAVKSKIQDIERGELSYVAKMPHDEALSHIAEIRPIHENHLAELQKIAAGKAEPVGMDEHNWRHAEARSGRQILSSEWAKNLAIPAKEAYIRSIDATEKAIKFFQKRHLKSLEKNDEEE